MTDWFVDSFERTAARWTRNGVPVTSGLFRAQYTSVDSGVLEYLQNDDTWSTAPFEFPLLLAADGFFARIFQVAATARRRTVTERPRHSVYGFGASAEHFVRSWPDDMDQDHQVDVAGVLTVRDAINHATVLGRWQLYDKFDAVAPYGKSAVRRVRL